MERRPALVATLAALSALLAACGVAPPPPAPAELAVRPLPDDRFEGTVYWEFDASALLAGEEVERYVWRFGELELEAHTDVVFRGFGRQGAYEAAVVATLEDGRTVEAAASFTIDDLPYDYWGAPPELVNADATGAAVPVGPGSGWAVNADGRFVAFTTEAAALPELDANDDWDVYVKDMETGELLLASHTEDGTAAGGEPPLAISGDGHYVVFYSDSTSLPGADGNDGDRVYRKDLETGELELVSTSAIGAVADDDSVLPTVSADGRYVAFGSYATNLTPLSDDYDACFFGLCPQGFAYVKDLATGRVAVVTVGLHDRLPDDWDQIEPRISGDGRYVVFYSWATNLGPGFPDDGSMNYYRAENPLWEPD